MRVEYTHTHTYTEQEYIETACAYESEYLTENNVNIYVVVVAVVARFAFFSAELSGNFFSCVFLSKTVFELKHIVRMVAGSTMRICAFKLLELNANHRRRSSSCINELYYRKKNISTKCNLLVKFSCMASSFIFYRGFFVNIFESIQNGSSTLTNFLTATLVDGLSKTSDDLQPAFRKTIRQKWIVQSPANGTIPSTLDLSVFLVVLMFRSALTSSITPPIRARKRTGQKIH